MSNVTKRSVSTDALETLGTIIDEKEKRDAIHLAVTPMVAIEKLYAGQDVGLVEGGASTKAPKMQGIVDPFLKVPVQPGQRFWMVLYPRMVTSLRHVWSHPEFSDEEGVAAKDPRGPKARAVQVIQDEADLHGVDYDELLAYAKEFVEYGSYQVQGGRWEGMGVGDEFWDAYELVTGTTVESGNRGGIFSCSC